jgi:hypothetical protein
MVEVRDVTVTVGKAEGLAVVVGIVHPQAMITKARKASKKMRRGMAGNRSLALPQCYNESLTGKREFRF